MLTVWALWVSRRWRGLVRFLSQPEAKVTQAWINEHTRIAGREWDR